jgi:hypothetical protein
MIAIRHIAGDNLRSRENRADFRWREELVPTFLGS